MQNTLRRGVKPVSSPPRLVSVVADGLQLVGEALGGEGQGSQVPVAGQCTGTMFAAILPLPRLLDQSQECLGVFMDLYIQFS